MEWKNAVNERRGLDFTRVLWHFATFKLRSETVDTSVPDTTKQALLLLAFSFGEKKGSKKRKSKRPHAVMKTHNFFAIRRRILLPANFLVAAFLRVFLLLYSFPWPFCETALDEPRLLVQIPDSSFRAHAAVVRVQKLLGKVKLNFNTKLSKFEEIRSILCHNNGWEKRKYDRDASISKFKKLLRILIIILIRVKDVCNNFYRI